MTKTPDTKERERAVYRVMFAHDAEVAARFDRAVWRAECVALALEIGEEVS